MNRRAFLLGFMSIGGQVLIIRELIGAFQGSELFIGTALFGWLLAVAAGAWIWEKLPGHPSPRVLFLLGIIILPFNLILIRLAPLQLLETVGENVPFITAALASIILAFPLGLISGALFPSLTHEGHRPAKSISRVYLFEGIGAFIGGIVVTALVGNAFDNLGMALAISFTTLIFCMIEDNRKISIVLLIILSFLLIGDFFWSPTVERYLDQKKYGPYRLIDSFETPYGHQALLESGGSVSLITDNALEATRPDRNTAEQLLIPPLAFKPDAKNLLFIGRTEFGVGEIAASFSGLKITAIDPREDLNDRLDRAILKSPGVIRVNDDPVSYLVAHDAVTPFDIIIIAPSKPDNILYSRYLTGRFLGLCRKVMAPDGLLYLPTPFDSDRYISPEKARLLSTYHRTLSGWFEYIDTWPGETTAFFASAKNLFEFFNEGYPPQNRFHAVPRGVCLPQLSRGPPERIPPRTAG